MLNNCLWRFKAGCLVAAMLFCGTAAADEPAYIKNAKGHEAPFTVGVSNGYIGNTWRAQFLADIEAVAEELKADGDFEEITVVNSTSGASGQISQINSLLSSDVDALVINPVSGEALKPVIARAIAAGVLVVIADDPLGSEDALNVVLNQAQFWGIQTEWMVEKLNGKGKIVAIEGLAGNTANDWRVRARDAVLEKNPGVELLASVPGAWDQAKAREAMTGLLAAHSQIDGVLIQDVMAEGVIRAYRAAQKPLPPMSGDYIHSFLKLWKKTPDLEAIVVGNPPGIGADALRVTAELLRGGKLKTDLLVENPVHPEMKNTILIPEPFVIEREGNKDREWCQVGTECISLDEALKRLEGKPDTQALDGYLTAKETRERYFE